MVKSLLKNGFLNGADFLTRTQNTIISAALILAVSSGLSAVLNLVKGRILTHYFGISDELGVFYTADRIPNLIYSVLIVGAVSTVFIPIFSDALKKDKDEAWKTASSVMNISMGVFLLIGFVIFVFSKNVISLISLNQFTQDQINLGSNLMRILLFSQFFLIIGSFMSSVLQTFRYFIITALAPIALNLGVMLSIFFLVPTYGIYAPAYGMVIGSVIYLLIQLPLALKAGFKFSIYLDFKNKGIRQLLTLVPPRILSVFMFNMVQTVNNSLAILVSLASVTIFKNAIQLQSFPVTFFGVSMASAVLPTLSEEAVDEDKSKFKKTFLTSFHQLMFMVIPASVVFLVLRIPIVRIVFGTSNYPWEATVKTAYVIAFYSFTIFSQSAIYLITRAFYALKDTLTPVKVSFVTILVNVTLSVFFIKYLHFGVWAIGLSYLITSISDLIVLFHFLSKKVGGFTNKELLIPFIKISYSAILMGLTLYIPLKLLDRVVFDTTRTLNLLLLTAIVSVAGGVTYLFFTKLLKVEEIDLFYKLLRKINFKVTVPANDTENV